MGNRLKIVRKSVHGQIADHLRKLILEGEFAVGTALPAERELAEQFDVSRNTLRQAISYLEAMGLLESQHGRGVFVTNGSDDSTIARFADVLLDPKRSLVDLVEGRSGLEPLAAGLAAERRTSQDLDGLEQFVGRHEHDLFVVPGNFHQRIARAAQNPVIANLLRALTAGPGSVSVLLEFDPEASRTWDHAHLDIFNAVKDGDSARAREAMGSHMQHVMAVAKRYEHELNM